MCSRLRWSGLRSLLHAIFQMLTVKLHRRPNAVWMTAAKHPLRSCLNVFIGPTDPHPRTTFLQRQPRRSQQAPHSCCSQSALVSLPSSSPAEPLQLLLPQIVALVPSRLAATQHATTAGPRCSSSRSHGSPQVRVRNPCEQLHRTIGLQHRFLDDRPSDLFFISAVDSGPLTGVTVIHSTCHLGRIIPRLFDPGPVTHASVTFSSRLFQATTIHAVLLAVLSHICSCSRCCWRESLLHQMQSLVARVASHPCESFPTPGLPTLPYGIPRNQQASSSLGSRTVSVPAEACCHGTPLALFCVSEIISLPLRHAIHNKSDNSFNRTNDDFARFVHKI